VPAGIPLAFAFRQAGNSAPQPRPGRRPAAAVVAAKPVQAKPRKQTSTPKPLPTPMPAEQASSATEHWIEEARGLANQGKLAEALTCCERNLRTESASAETFHLVGLLHDAAGRVQEAAEHYRKALYLDPRHPEALVHLAVALQRQGDARGAQRLFERANRQSAPGASKGGG
jgi:chemotaxis protein methyltransferase WspC